jgi:hypothetical protein
LVGLYNLTQVHACNAYCKKDKARTYVPNDGLKTTTFKAEEQPCRMDFNYHLRAEQDEQPTARLVFVNGIQKLFFALAVGAIVKLNINLYVPFGAKVGLFNGALGKVHTIVYTDERGPFSKHLPSFIVVEFFSYSGPALFGDTPTDTSAPRTTKQRLVPIYPQQLRCDCGKCFREGFPLSVRAASTIHTMQGMTVKPTSPGPCYVVAHLNNKAVEQRWPGGTYTALSRNTDINFLVTRYFKLSGTPPSAIGSEQRSAA